MSIRRHMSNVRQYELIYIAPPETTDEALAELQHAGGGRHERFGATIEKTENWGRRKLAYEIGRHREGVYVLDVINGPAALDGRARSPAARVRHRHPSHGRARRRGTGGRRARARRAARRPWPRAACAAACRPSRPSRSAAAGARRTTTWTARTWASARRRPMSDFEGRAAAAAAATRTRTTRTRRAADAARSSAAAASASSASRRSTTSATRT